MNLGRGGGHGGHGGHGGGPFFYDAPYGDYFVPVYEYGDEPPRPRVHGEGLTVGTGALLVLGLLALAVFEADRRVPK
jgi:hypothetical protein